MTEFLKVARLRHVIDAGETALQIIPQDMPTKPPKSICGIWGVHAIFNPVEFEVWEARLSIDPDETFTDFSNPSIIYTTRLEKSGAMGSVLFQQQNPIMFPFPFPCPFTKVVWGLQRTVAAIAKSIDLAIYWMGMTVTPLELATQVVRRGRGETRRVP